MVPRAAVLLALSLLSGRASADIARAAHLPESIDVLTKEMLAQPHPRAGQGGVHSGFMAYSRAFASYALIGAALDDPGVASEASRRVDALIDQMLDPGISEAFGRETVSVAGHSLAASVAYRGHLALMLSGRARLGQLRPDHRALDEALLDGLAIDCDRASNQLLPSYGVRTWPADNEVLAAAFALAPAELAPAVQAHVSAALASLQTSLATLEKDGLPASAVSPGRLKGIDVPRGCALSWTVAMRGLYDTPRAQSLYTRYRSRYFVELGPIAGFREWPRGHDRPQDADSGPIVMGIGTAASGIGLAAARLAGKTDDFTILSRASWLAGASSLESARHRKWLERAMLAWARGARSWAHGR